VKLSRELLATIKESKLMLDWRKHQQARTEVRVMIEMLDTGLPKIYTPVLFKEKTAAVFKSVDDAYNGLTKYV
jgi:type I restriction enzyme, R subunit